jgi:hypothetical protein
LGEVGVFGIDSVFSLLIIIVVLGGMLVIGNYRLEAKGKNLKIGISGVSDDVFDIVRFLSILPLSRQKQQQIIELLEKTPSQPSLFLGRIIKLKVSNPNNPIIALSFRIKEKFDLINKPLIKTDIVNNLLISPSNLLKKSRLLFDQKVFIIKLTISTVFHDVNKFLLRKVRPWIIKIIAGILLFFVSVAEVWAQGDDPLFDMLVTGGKSSVGRREGMISYVLSGIKSHGDIIAIVVLVLAVIGLIIIIGIRARRAFLEEISLIKKKVEGIKKEKKCLI